MHDVAISIIHNYIEENLFSPSLSWDRYEFKKRSYEQWAAYEILERIMDHPFDMPVDIVEIFMFEMYYCAHFCGEDEPRTFIFQTAVSVAEDILLLFV